MTLSHETEERPDRIELFAARWTHSVAWEELIDLAEWAQVRSRPCLTRHPYAFTAPLWSFLESIPFAEIGRSSLDQRIEVLHRSASRALESALAGIPDGPAGWMIHFTSPLQSRSDGPRRQQFGMHVTFTDRDRFAVVVGLSWEFAAETRGSRVRPGPRG